MLLAEHAGTTPGAAESEFVSSFEAARILDSSPDNVRLYARTGRLPVAIETRAGRLFRRADVLALASTRARRSSGSGEAGQCAG